MFSFAHVWWVAILFFVGAKAETPEEWVAIAKEELRLALRVQPIIRKARNVVFFLGDGMGIATSTAGRIYKGQLHGHKGEEGCLVWEDFPHVGLSKTYNDNAQTPDSAGTATAYFCGQKADLGVIGVDSSVRLGNCSSSKGHAITSVLQWAQEAGKATGLVTTTRITHATPAGTYAHSAHRDWEYDAAIPIAERNCTDIARQLIENVPGKNINVILGGGRSLFVPINQKNPITNQSGLRGDGIDLLQKWKDQQNSGSGYKLVSTRDELNAIDPKSTGNVLGLFSDDHMEYEIRRERLTPYQPSLTEMVQKAIQLLLPHENGFFLAVEGGKIDLAHHTLNAKISLHEVYSLDNAVATALQMLPLDDTLVVGAPRENARVVERLPEGFFAVTADHSHTLSITGYPERGNPILGIAGLGADNLPYTTLSYANGPNAVLSFPRPNLTNVDTESEEYVSEVLVPIPNETHGGEDVAIYAKGPFAHLFHTLHEQHYIPYVLDYAGCYRADYPHCNPSYRKR